MNIEGSKIKALIDHYGLEKGYPEKSYTAKFCEDFDVNYIQWRAYTRNTQKAGIKIIYFLMDVFPDLNMNWLLKDERNMFLSQVGNTQVSERPTNIKKEVTNSDIMKKLIEIHRDLKTVGVK
ncbi:MAG: hypothetical protein ABI441_03700 [Flavobacterium sp.]